MAGLPLCLFISLVLFSNQCTGDNLALRKRTWQTNTLHPYSSDKAVDGRMLLRTKAGGQCAISHGNNTEAMWIVDLGKVQAIHAIFMFFRKEISSRENLEVASRILGFSVYVSNTTRMMDGVRCYHDNTQIPEHIEFRVLFRCIVQARYVIYYNSRLPGFARISGYSQFAHVDLCEAYVYGCNYGFYGFFCDKPCPRNCQFCHIDTGECLGKCNPGYFGQNCREYKRDNLAFLRQTHAKHPYADTALSKRAVDGKKSNLSYGSQQCFFTQNGQSFALWYVDLAYIRGIERVVVYYRTENRAWGTVGYLPGRFLGFSILVSNTTDIRDGVVCFRDTKYNQSSIPAIFDVDCHLTGRYVFYYNERIPSFEYPSDYSKFAFADICEVEVYGCPFPDFIGPDCAIPCYSMCKERYLENLAFRKPTWLSSIWHDHTPERAVDGNTADRHYKSGSCTVSYDVHRVIWGVDLKAVTKIEYVIIYFRTDDYPWDRSNDLAGFPLGFSLVISNTTNKSDGLLCFHDTNYTRDTIPKTLKIMCPYTGRYVIYYNERLPGKVYPSDYYRYARADLCEVEVYGCPVPVENLPACHSPCPKNCDCYQGTGVCRECFEGYEGDNCELEKSGFSSHCD